MGYNTFIIKYNRPEELDSFKWQFEIVSINLRKRRRRRSRRKNKKTTGEERRHSQVDLSKKKTDFL